MTLSANRLFANPKHVISVRDGDDHFLTDRFVAWNVPLMPPKLAARVQDVPDGVWHVLASGKTREPKTGSSPVHDIRANPTRMREIISADGGYTCGLIDTRLVLAPRPDSNDAAARLLTYYFDADSTYLACIDNDLADVIEHPLLEFCVPMHSHKKAFRKVFITNVSTGEVCGVLMALRPDTDALREALTMLGRAAERL